MSEINDMNWLIPFTPQPSSIKVEEGEALFTIGSCFSQRWAESLGKRYWPACTSPLGICYNPVSLLRQLEYIFSKREVNIEQVVFHQGRWYHFDFHSHLSAPDRGAVIQMINEKLVQAREQIMNANHMIITLGTSLVYQLTESQHVVNNCHRLPAKMFDSRFLTFSEVKQSLDGMSQLIAELQSIKQIIWTVSPIRHKRSGLVNNNRSKARLLLAVEEVCSSYAQHYYFPAYEILIDQLRDYRFYDRDLVHPAAEARDYIFAQARSALFSAEAQKAWAYADQVYTFVNHKPRWPHSESAVSHKKASLERLTHCKQRYPWMSITSK